MPDTIPNIIIEPNTATDLYAESGLTVGVKINVAIIGTGTSRLYAGATAPPSFDNASGFRNLETDEEFTNDTGDAGAWIWSSAGCIVNVKEVV